MRDGSTVFRQRGFDKSNLLAVGSQLLILEENGQLVVGQFKDGMVVETCRVSVFENTAWTVPAIVNGRLLMRNGRKLKVFQLN